MSGVSLQDRFRGCLLGLAAGDALGTTLEFKEPGTFDPIDDMIGGGPFPLEPGQWTDDTSMALCLATSLIEKDGFDPTGPDETIRPVVARGLSVLDWGVLRHRHHRQERSEPIREHRRPLFRLH